MFTAHPNAVHVPPALVQLVGQVQVCVPVSQPSPREQSVLVRHCTQEPVGAKHAGLGAEQLALVRHWTHWPLVVLQTGVCPPQLALDVQAVGVPPAPPLAGTPPLPPPPVPPVPPIGQAPRVCTLEPAAAVHVAGHRTKVPAVGA
jgi:hypothetical protein